MKETTWLDNLKPGDKVIVSAGYYPDTIEEVERTTATLVILTNGERFNKKDGRKQGATGYRIPYIYEAHPGELARIQAEAKRRALFAELRGVKWDKLPTEALEQVMAIVKAAQP